MPYIKQQDRNMFRKVLNDLPAMVNKGELEYCIFVLMQRFMSGQVFCYASLHDAVYAAQHCADEFRRRFLDTRENTARAENGDIGAFDDEFEDIDVVFKYLSVLPKMSQGWVCKKCKSWWPDGMDICQHCGRSKKSQEGPNGW